MTLGGEAFGKTTIVTSVDALREDLLEAFTLWLVHHRGVEGVDEEELLHILRIWPNVKWLAIYAMNKHLAAALLTQGVFDPKEADE